MRRVLIALVAVVALSLAASTGAQARCSVACLNHRVQQLSNGLIRAEKKIASLNRTVSQQAQTIGEVGKKVDGLYTCLLEVPVTQYGAPEAEGYLYETASETFKTTALDVPFKGEPVSAWFLIDGCNSLTTAGLSSTRALAPAASLGSLLAPQRRLFP